MPAASHAHPLTTVEDVLSVLHPGERVSYPTLLDRLCAHGHTPSGMVFVLRNQRFRRLWRNGQPYTEVRLDNKDRGPMFIELTLPS